MSTTGKFLGAIALLLFTACSRGSPRAQGEPVTARAAALASKPVAPTRLLSLPVSAYTPSLALDGDVVYLLTRGAVYRVAAGKPPQRTELDLGIGPVLAESGIVFWSNGAVWNAAKEGGSVWRLATVPKQPEYFVASSGGIAWLDRADDGAYRLQALDGQKARVLVAHQTEISAVHMIHDRVFFVARGKDNSWRIGSVHKAGGEPSYTESRTGPTPAQLAGTESVVYYDMDKSEIRQLTQDLMTEHVWLKDFVCSPIHEANHVFCGRVEGLFEVLADSHTPRPLVLGRHETITLVRANAKQVVWIADLGPDQLAVDMLPVVP